MDPALLLAGWAVTLALSGLLLRRLWIAYKHAELCNRAYTVMDRELAILENAWGQKQVELQARWLDTPDRWAWDGAEQDLLEASLGMLRACRSDLNLTLAYAEGTASGDGVDDMPRDYLALRAARERDYENG